jgi:omega-hydroxy-beta-dihydromenaquinone-9 sulfotransferase
VIDVLLLTRPIMKISFDSQPVPGNHILSGATPRVLYRLLRDNKFRVRKDRRGLVLRCLTLALVNYPNVVLERMLYNRRIRKTTISEPVFILGYPRSGTTNMVYLLSHDKRFTFSRTYECIAPHVIFTFGKVMRRILDRTLPKTRPMDNMPLGARLPKEEEFAIANMTLSSMVHALYFPTRFMDYVKRYVLFTEGERDKMNWKKYHRFFLQKIIFKNHGRQILVKSPFNTGRVKEILEDFPDAKFIHIFRHPYSVFSSNEKLYEGVLPQTALQDVTNDLMEQHLFDSYRLTYEKYLREKVLIPEGNLYEVKYEDFIGNEMFHLEEMYHILGLADFNPVRQVFENAISRQKDYRANTHHRDEEKLLRIKKEWEFAFKAFGYE